MEEKDATAVIVVMGASEVEDVLLSTMLDELTPNDEDEALERMDSLLECADIVGLPPLVLGEIVGTVCTAELDAVGVDFSDSWTEELCTGIGDAVGSSEEDKASEVDALGLCDGITAVDALPDDSSTEELLIAIDDETEVIEDVLASEVDELILCDVDVALLLERVVEFARELEDVVAMGLLELCVAELK